MAAIFCVGLGAFFVIGISEHGEPAGFRELRFDEPVSQEDVRPTDLKGDLRKMWETVAHNTIDHKTIRVSPVSAINAASRVFATVDLIGKTTNEVFELVGHNTKSSDSVYNRGFYPTETNQIAYCFECGNFGWQFTLTVDASGRVTDVEKAWIP